MQSIMPPAYLIKPKLCLKITKCHAFAKQEESFLTTVLLWICSNTFIKTLKYIAYDFMCLDTSRLSDCAEHLSLCSLTCQYMIKSDIYTSMIQTHTHTHIHAHACTHTYTVLHTHQNSKRSEYSVESLLVP